MAAPLSLENGNSHCLLGRAKSAPAMQAHVATTQQGQLVIPSAQSVSLHPGSLEALAGRGYNKGSRQPE
jgi:hypothetical protein